MIKRIYLSGPITGTDDYLERFEAVENRLKEQGFSVINPARVTAALPPDLDYEEYMELDFRLLDLCNMVYMLNGWEKSCGANREYGYAMAAGKMIFSRRKEQRALVNQLITKEPVAYDLDRVVEEIKNIGTRFCTNVHCNDECSDCDHGAIMKAIIETVKRGGTDEGN